MRKSRKTLLMVLVLILSVAIECSLCNSAKAMQFTEPVEIGRVYTKGGPPFYAKNALTSSVQDKYYDFNSKAGVVRLTVSPNSSFGSVEDSKNAVSLRHLSRFTIYEITGNGLPLFVILDGGTDSYFGVTIVGKDKSGRYIKYIGADRFYSILNQWFPDDEVGFIEISPKSPWGQEMGRSPEITVDGNTLLLKCAIAVNAGRAGYRHGQFSFKWDDAAEWFGIDYKLFD